MRKVTAALMCLLLWAGLAAAQKTRIAMEQIQLEGQSLGQTQTALSSYLAGELKRVKNVVLVGGEELSEAMRKAQATAIIDKETAVAAGKLAKARAVVWGRMSDSGQKLSFWLKMVDVKTGKLLFAKSYSVDAGADGAKRDFERNIVSIAQDLVAMAAGTNRGLSELKIIVASASGVRSMDAVSTPDVYATVQVGDEIIGTTGFKQNNANPAWNETFTAKYRGEKIKLSFFDRDLVKDEFIGSCVLDEPKSGTYDIVGRHLGQPGKKGTVTLRFEVKPFQAVEE